MTDSDRRYTDQEVALVLAKASELDEGRALTSTSGRGLTLRELHEIAREVGLSPRAIDEAVTALRTQPHQSILGSPYSHRVVRGIPGRLEDSAMQRLVRVVEDRLEATGTVTEALGTVRWTSVGRGHKFDRTTQVSFTPTGHETQIQVVQRYPDALRFILHLLPGAWGGMIGLAVGGTSGLATLPWVAAVAGTAAVGVGIGRAIWNRMARKSADQVEEVAAVLVGDAQAGEP